MRLHFTIHSIPELASLPRTKREDVWQRCHGKAWRHWQTWAAFFVFMACLAAGYYLGIFTQPDGAFSLARLAVGILLVVVGSGGLFPVQAAMTRRYIADELNK